MAAETMAIETTRQAEGVGCVPRDGHQRVAIVREFGQQASLGTAGARYVAN